MSSAISRITDAFGLTDTRAGERAHRAASELQADYQREALDYLKEREELPQTFREGALTGLAGEYGLNLDDSGQLVSDGSTISDRALSSPFYTAGVKQAEEAILRNAAATGGLRSGNTQDALARANQDLFLKSYQNQLSGLGSLASLPSNASQIAAGTAGIGQTLGHEYLGGVQSRIAGQNQVFSDALGVGKLAVGLTNPQAIPFI